MVGQRFNPVISKHVNGIEDDSAVSSGAWLTEFWVGPAWRKRVHEKFNLSVNILYQPQIWSLDEKIAGRYFRHNIQQNTDLMFILSHFSIRFRLMLWNQFKTITAENKELDNEFFTRWLIGMRIPVHKKISLVFEDEIFLKLTADDDDKDGLTEFFVNNSIWAGADFTIKGDLKAGIRYIFMYINRTSSLAQKTTMFDHYSYFQISYSTDFTKK